MTYAYLRQIPGAKNLTIQQKEVIGFALSRGIEIDREIVEHSSRNRPIEERKQFEEFMHSMNEGDTLIVDEIWTLSSHTDELIKILSCMISRNIRLLVANQGVAVNKETPVGQLLPLLNISGEKRQVRQSGVGRPKGSKSRSKFDAMQPVILEKLKEGESVSAIARDLGVSRSSLKDYIESRSLRELIDNTFVEIGKPLQTDIIGDDTLICPYEQDRANHTSNSRSNHPSKTTKPNTQGVN
jgi:DNA invertase Pin-like site-specific DNA recombinase